MSAALIGWIAAAPALSAVVSRLVGRPAGRAVALALAGSTLAAVTLLVGAGSSADGVWSGPDWGPWISVSVDRVAALLLVAFTLLGTVVSVFAGRSFDDEHQSGPFQGRLAVLVGGSALVVVAGSPAFLIVGWLASSRSLVGLVDGWVDTTAARRAVGRLRRTMRIADTALVAAVVLGVAIAGPELTAGDAAAFAELSDTSLLGVDTAVLFAALLAVAGGARSTLVPAHRWLTSTLFAPTPVSAIVHAGFVAGAGVLILRFAPAFAAAEIVLWILGGLAVVTIAIATVASLSRPDAKGGLAWSTVAQMAFMVVQVLIGAFAAAAVHIVGHGMYKAAHFLGVGDTVSAALRARRRPQPGRPFPAPVASAAAAVLSVSAVGLGALLGPDDLSGAEQLLLFGTAGLALGGAARGVLLADTHRRSARVLIAALGSLAASLAYFGSVAVVKSFLEPVVPTVDVADGYALTMAAATLGVIVALAALVLVPSLGPARSTVRWWVDRATALGPAPVPVESPVASPVARPAPIVEPSEPDDVRLATLRSHVNRAAEIVAPSWPLSSFVAVNPLTGLEHFDFDRAAVEAAALRGRVYRPLDDFRADHLAGLTTDEDLEWAAVDLASVAAAAPDLELGETRVRAIELVITDLCVGPEIAPNPEPRTELERRAGIDAGERLGLDDLVSSWVLDHLTRPALPLAHQSSSFWTLARLQIQRQARHAFGPAAVGFADSLGADPLESIDHALSASQVRPAARVDELRGLLASVRGCVALARWRTDWADPAESTPMIRVVEIAAARAAIDTLVVLELEARHGAGPVTTGGPSDRPETDDPALDARVDAVMAARGLPGDAGTRAVIANVLALVPDSLRPAIWQRAQERRFDQRAFALLERPIADPAASRPASQLVFCIDVRSEGLRRRIEHAGRDETLGFAGFFGIPMRVQEFGWAEPEARCPVLVAPTTTATETLEPKGASNAVGAMRRRATGAIARRAHGATKQLPGSPFVTAEALGVFSGVRAAWRTIRPARHSSDSSGVTGTVVRFEETVGLDQRLFWAESVLRTMGLVDGFGRLVVLCGHTSHTVNNAHATALECGACGGAGGAANARAVAGLLNDTDIRAGLAGRGIEIPDDTWFTAAVHETTTDGVELLDQHLVPASHHADLDSLADRLAEAGALHAAHRATQLPGDAPRVRDRGLDWAQPRPEWGLAGNAAFVIGPRSMTAGLDLDGRAFLHSYEPADDPEGAVLESIMTAPLVVGHWISAQYYFSTVDPETFGSGDKLLHNPVGSLGVLTGAGGDIRVGLPKQSTHVGDTPHHQPLRLLALVQADPAIVDRIIARNPVLSRLVEGSWLRVAARAGAGDPWSQRSRTGVWTTEPGLRPADPELQPQ